MGVCQLSQFKQIQNPWYRLQNQLNIKNWRGLEGYLNRDMEPDKKEREERGEEEKHRDMQMKERGWILKKKQLPEGNVNIKNKSNLR